MRLRIKSGEIDVMVTEGLVDEGGRSQVGKESSADCCMAAFEMIVPVGVVHFAIAEDSGATVVEFFAFFELRDLVLALMMEDSLLKEAESFARYSVSFVFAQGGVESCLPRNLGLAGLRDWLE